MDSKNRLITNASGGASASVSDALGNVIASSYIADVSWNSETRVLSCLGASGNVIGSVEIPSRGLVDDVTKPLMFRAVEDNSSVTLNKVGSYTGTYLYSLDGQSWSSYTYGTAINLNAEDCVYFKVDDFGTKSFSNFCQFSMTGTIEAWHNVNSMVSSNFADLTDLSSVGDRTLLRLFLSCARLFKSPLLPATTLAASCYNEMFNGCTRLTQAPALPATTLTTSCYKSMFYGCSSLTQAPVLPATTLELRCYENMFYSCPSLTQAPALPATTLADNCYTYMFYECSGLTQAPALPATTLAQYCYRGMFSHCTSLTQAPVLPATTLTYYCYQAMFYECSGLTQAPALSATTLATYCCDSMFYGCTRLTQAPELLAATLQQSCYSSMFRRCSSLNTVTCRATNLSAAYCTTNWLDGVAASGDFYTPQSTNWSSGVNGIPNGWTRHDI